MSSSIKDNCTLDVAEPLGKVLRNKYAIKANVIELA
jgi:hypothetical protein